RASYSTASPGSTRSRARWSAVPFAARVRLPRTSSARRPSSAAVVPSDAIDSGPKMIRVGAENSKRIASALAPFRVGRLDVVVANTLAGLGHPVLHGGTPGRIGLGRLGGGEGVLGAVDLVEEEARRIVLGLEDVEADATWLPARVARVVARRRDEGIDRLRRHQHRHPDDVHLGPSCSRAGHDTTAGMAFAPF